MTTDTAHGGHHHHNHGGPGEMISVEAHLADILSTVRRLTPINLAISEAEGCVLAEDIAASRPLPPFDNSAMDGYAVIAADLAEASKDTPVTLRVSGEVAAGDTGAYAVTPGSCLRITTGAKLPGGADAVVPVEDTDGGVAQVKIKVPVSAGDSVRYSGGDARQGEVLLPAGTQLSPMQIAVLAASGRARAEVYPRPRLVVLSTGNELTDPGRPLAPGKIWDSNSYMLTAAAREAGCLAFRHGPIPDDPLELLPAIEDQLLRADLIVTSGGVSMGGEHDVVKETLSRLGTVSFRKVAMQPGMPQGFGTIGEDRTPIFTLPGNQVSAYVSFQLFVRAALGALQGQLDRRLPALPATLTGPLRSPPGRRSYLRGVLNAAEGTVVPLTGQGSHQIATLGRANALIVVPEWVVQLNEGDSVEVLVLP
ncbi:MAG TPA: gephyrin-like molybdotransferase Glp [Streptosporangiaceae bacterium]|nr:gephyrin-like molybdotransferase Glp [Streptosporangiaceae bacterium]